MALILIVEDHAEIRRLIRWTLEPEGHQLHEARNAAEGWRLALQLRPALIVLDVMLPGGEDGYALCHRLKRDAELGAIPVVLLTSLDGQGDRRNGEKAGADEHLGKPFVPLELVEVVERWVAALDRG